MWHCAQTATKSRLLIFLKSTGGSSGPFLYSSPVFIEATCLADGPWHISQLIPGLAKFEIVGFEASALDVAQLARVADRANSLITRRRVQFFPQVQIGARAAAASRSLSSSSATAFRARCIESGRHESVRSAISLHTLAATSSRSCSRRDRCATGHRTRKYRSSVCRREFPCARTANDFSPRMICSFPS